MAMVKKRTLESMTKEQKRVYYKKFHELRDMGMGKWNAIFIARRVAYHKELRDK